MGEREDVRSELEQLIGDVEEGEDVYISRDDEYVAVLIGYDRYVELTARLSDLSPHAIRWPGTDGHPKQGAQWVCSCGADGVAGGPGISANRHVATGATT